MNIDFSELLNVFDIFSLIIISLSILFSLKGGFLKSFLNFIKWIILIFTIKYSFVYLRDPFSEALKLSTTLIDIIIFISVFIIGYVTLTLLNRLLLGLINANTIGPINRLLGLVFGIFRGYIFSVIIFSLLINWSFSENILNSYNNNAVLFGIIKNGSEAIKIIPKNVESKIDSI
mgnify:CR=1 FL=1